MSRKFFQIVAHNVNYEIVGFRRKFLTISSIAFIASLIFIFTKGLNFGIDFSGGTEIQLEFSQAYVKDAKNRDKLKLTNFRKTMDKRFPKLKASPQQFGADGRGYIVKFQKVVSGLSGEKLKALQGQLEKKFASYIPPKQKGKKVLRPFFNFRKEGGNKIDLFFTEQGGKKPAPRKAATTKPAKKKGSKANKSKYALVAAQVKKIFEDNKIEEISIDEPLKQRGGFEISVTFAGLSSKFTNDLVKDFLPIKIKTHAEYLKLKKKDPKAARAAIPFKILRVESVGPRVGRQLREQGILAILLANLFILIYIAIRFDFRYAPGATAALIHDVTITTGLFSILGLPFDLSIVAALLTIVGYSLNDTIVVYDRIRENWQKSRVNFGDVMNRSINETLSRTLLTSITTFIAVVPIYLVGGGNIKWFAFAMMFGILIGTYSSIAIASPLVFYLDQYFSRKERGEDEEKEEKRDRRRRRRAGLAT